MDHGKRIMTIAIAALLAWPGVSWAQGEPVSPASPRGQVSGTLPVIIKLKPRSAFAERARVAAMGPRRPMVVAPSAIAYGHSDFSALPADLSFYAGLSERPEPGSAAMLSAVEVRFVNGPSFLMALDTTLGEVLIGTAMARKLLLNAGKESSAGTSWTCSPVPSNPGAPRSS